MIKATELRIGNLLEARIKKYNNSEHISITASGLMDIFSNGEKSFTEYNPIILTEDWLIGLKLPIEFGIGKDIGGIFYWINGAKKYLKYVHQLQNLYFALTGEELTRVDG